MFNNEKPNLKDLYTVHVGNLNAKTTYDELRILFSGTGNIKDLFIQNKLVTKFTYAFVRFQTLEECTKACMEVHGAILHGSAIYVTLADSTNIKTDGHSAKSNNKSISKTSFPRKEGANYVASEKDEKEIHHKLKHSLTNLQKKNQLTEWMGIQSREDVQLFMRDFKDILVGMVKVPKSIGVDALCYENKQSLPNLQKLIINHHSCSVSNTGFQPFKVVDFDLTTHEEDNS